jgi:hypothetical protein
VPFAEVYFPGATLRIDITADGVQSLQELHTQHKGNASVIAALARTDRLLKRLGEMGRLKSREEFKLEVSKDVVHPAFWAVRAIPIRAYGWYGPDRAFVISHFIQKRKDRLSDADVARMKVNFKSYLRPQGI